MLKCQIKVNPTIAWMKVKVSRPAGVLLVSRIGPLVIKLLLIGAQWEENGLKKRTKQQCNTTTEVSMGEMDTVRECMSYGMK